RTTLVTTTYSTTIIVLSTTKPKSLITFATRCSPVIGSGNAALPPGLSSLTARPIDPTTGNVDCGRSTITGSVAMGVANTNLPNNGSFGRYLWSHSHSSSEQSIPPVTNSRPFWIYIHVPLMCGTIP